VQHAHQITEVLYGRLLNFYIPQAGTGPIQAGQSNADGPSQTPAPSITIGLVSAAQRKALMVVMTQRYYQRLSTIINIVRLGIHLIF
jgi:hypothetical protein